MMMDALQGIAYGIVAFAVLVVVGTVVVTKVGDTAAVCNSGYTYSTTTRTCLNATGGDSTAVANTAYLTHSNLLTQLGSTGLAGWVPAVIAVAIGALFLSYFMGKKR